MRYAFAVIEVLACVATDLEGAGLEKLMPVLTTGIGPVNAATALTRFLSRNEVAAVISCGIGGAYPGSGLEVGEAVCAAEECYADLGAQTPEGFLDMEALGFPVVNSHYNRLPLDLFPAGRRVPFVTTSTCTGADAGAREIAARTGGAVESMEGAAIVHVAILHGVSVGEVRGISNAVGDRDRSTWRVKEAAGAARAALAEWLNCLP